MSRSRKSVPGYVDRNPYAKKMANRRIRNIVVKLDENYDNTNHEVPNFGKYVKYSEQWDICDWRWCFHTARSLKSYVDSFGGIRWGFRGHSFRNDDHMRNFIIHRTYSK